LENISIWKKGLPIFGRKSKLLDEIKDILDSDKLFFISELQEQCLVIKTLPPTESGSFNLYSSGKLALTIMGETTTIHGLTQRMQFGSHMRICVTKKITKDAVF